MNLLRYPILAIAACLALLLGSCNTTKYLKEDELLLHKNEIAVTTEASKREVGSLPWKLETLTKQQPNKRTFYLARARLWWWYQAQRHIVRRTTIDPDTDMPVRDTSGIYKFVLRRVAEPPALYSATLTDETAESMQFYLNNLGFYQARVTSSVAVKKKKVTVTYEVTTDSFMRIGQVEYRTDDFDIKTILPKLEAQSELKPGLPLDSRTFDAEKTRLVNALKNEGYRFFYPNYITYQGDSTGLQTHVYVNILPPTDSSLHERYHVRNIYIYPDHQLFQLRDTKYDAIPIAGLERVYMMVRSGEKPPIQPRVLARALALEPDSLYNATTEDQTYRQLSRLGLYKFISIKSVPVDPVGDDPRNWIDYNLYLTPYSKMDGSASGSFSYVSNDPFLGNAVGLFFDVNYKNRNIFKRGQLLNLSAGYGLEFPTGDNQIDPEAGIFTQDIRVQADLVFPPISRNANLRLTSSFNQVQRFRQYDYNQLNGELAIDWKYSAQSSFTFTPISLNYLNPEVRPEFQVILDANPLLDRSFDKQMVVGGDASFTYNAQNTARNSSFSVRTRLDFAGNLLYILDQAIVPSQPFTFASLNYSQYSLGEVEAKYFKGYGRNFTVANRLNIGVAYPYLNSSEAGLPYVKQFFAGGNNGLRAWRVRQLGPGGSPEADTTSIAIPFQTGDAKFEGNVELRFAMDYLFSGLKGAAFIDYGNVWSLTDTTSNGVKLLRPDNFLHRIAIGAGVGARFDFSFFILRADFAWRIRRPYSATGDDADYSTYWERAHQQALGSDPRRWLSRGRLNLAIGYPF